MREEEVLVFAIICSIAVGFVIGMGIFQPVQDYDIVTYTGEVVKVVYEYRVALSENQWYYKIHFNGSSINDIVFSEINRNSVSRYVEGDLLEVQFQNVSGELFYYKSSLFKVVET